MPRSVRQPFNPRGEYVARRSFTCNGHSFTFGGDFPWKRLAVDVRKLYRLWDLKFIDVKGGDIPFEEETEIEETELEETEPDEIVAERTESEIIGGGGGGTGFTFDPEVHTLENPKRGEYWVMKAGETVLRISRKEWQRLEKKELPEKVNPDRVISEE